VACELLSISAGRDSCHTSCVLRVCETETAESGSRCDEVGGEEGTQGCRHEAGVRLITGEMFANANLSNVQH